MLRSLASRLKFRRRDSVLRQVHDAALTYLEPCALQELYDTVAAIEAQQLPGLLVEAGCALGGSAIVITAAKARTRPLRVYDVFGRIPAPSERDGEDVQLRYSLIQSGAADGIRGHQYYGYEDNLYEIVKGNFADLGFPIDAYNTQLIKGLFEDTLNFSEPVALAHIDGDWYDSVLICLERTAPHVVQGGVLVIDDYEAWSGCHRAVEDFLAINPDAFSRRQRARLHLIKN
jgi:hypothetical protein